MLSAAQESLAGQVLSSLQEELYSAWATVAGNSSLFNGEIRATVLNNLSADNLRIARLGADLLDSARAGTLAFKNWLEIASTTRADIAYQVGDSSAWSLTGVIKAALLETYTDIRDGSKEALASVGGGAGIGALVGFLLVVGLWVKFK